MEDRLVAKLASGNIREDEMEKIEKLLALYERTDPDLVERVRARMTPEANVSNAGANSHLLTGFSLFLPKPPLSPLTSPPLGRGCRHGQRLGLVKHVRAV